jgi:hypothetical protein
MTSPETLIAFNLSKGCIYLFIASWFALTACSQEVYKTEEWWVPITQKHDIRYDSYTLRGDCFIIGEKSVDGEIENYKNVTVIAEDPETNNYLIWKSMTASYDHQTKILKINNCTLETFQNDSKSLESVKSYKDIDFISNFETNVHTMVDKTEWWVPITQKHDIKYDSYTLRKRHFIIGEKSVDGEIENFKNITVISKGSEYYWICKSKTASYNPQTATLKINNCTLEGFRNDSKSLEPEKSHEHIDLSINFEKNSSTMTQLPY